MGFLLWVHNLGFAGGGAAPTFQPAFAAGSNVVLQPGVR